MKKDDAKSRFGVSVLHAQIPLSSRRITLDLSDKSHPLSLERIKHKIMHQCERRIENAICNEEADSEKAFKAIVEACEVLTQFTSVDLTLKWSLASKNERGLLGDVTKKQLTTQLS